MSRKLSALVLILAAVGCMEGQKTAPQQRSAATEPKPTGATAKASLYERLGGEPAIKKVVDDLVAEVVADPKIRERHKKHFMDPEQVPELKKKLVDQLGEATGGPQKYTGRNMKESHAGMGITEAEFGALVEDLKKSLAKFNVPQAEQDELIGALAKMHDDIVEKP